MLEADLKRVAMLRAENYSYQFIADKLGISANTVKSICRRYGFEAYGARKTKQEKQQAALCKYCLQPLPPGKRKDVSFCSAHCRTAWRRKHLNVHAEQT